MNWKHNHLNKTTKFAFIYKIVLVFSLAFLTACTKDVLEKEPLTSYSDATVWKDANLIDAYINNTYRTMPYAYNDYGNWWAHSLSCLSDESNRRRNSGYRALNSGALTPSNCDRANWWTEPTSYWDIIKNCNTFFENIGVATFDQAIKDRMTGEMKFFRAYSYFKLTALYNGVPLIKKTFTLTDDFYLPRNTYDECMEFVINELDEAVSLLPLTYDDSNAGRITKGTAMACKARALLYMASPLNNPSNDQTKWQKAADAAKAIIDLNIYSLYSDYGKSYMASTLYNSEVIWARLFNQNLFPEFPLEQSLFPNGYYGFGQVNPLQNLVDEYEMLSGKLPKDDPAYDPQNPYVNRDPRFYNCILYDGAMFQGREVETFIPGGKDTNEGTVTPWNAGETSYYVRKFVDESIINPGGTNSGNSPWPFFRYNEVLLNYAEAKYYLGDEATCREYLNMIRSRPSVNMPPVTESGLPLLERLRHERKIELYFEEHRWFDVRRWKIAEVVNTFTPTAMQITKDINTGIKTYAVIDLPARTFPNSYYYMPIPQEEMNKNPNLVQNPGYN
jgi:starch-binding outer membrane protein, SusD/RagB family